MKHFALSLITAAGLMAQNSVQGPSVGWIYDQAHTALRPIHGIPGSSTLGEVLDAGVSLATAAIAPGGAYALAITGEGDTLFLDLATGQSRKLAVPQGGESIVLSPRATAAAIVYKATGKAVWISGLPGASESKEIEITGSAFALSDDGKAMLAVEQGKVTVIDRDGNRWGLNHSGAIRMAAFVDGTTDVIVSDEQGLWRLKDVTNNAVAARIWQGEAAAFAIAVNRRQLLVIEASKSLTAVDMDNGSVRRIECACDPVALMPLSAAVFRVNELSDGPLWLVDLNGSEPRTVFVPAEMRAE